MPPLMQLKNIHFSIGDQSIINHINLSINAGDFIVILGGNGSGKSTLLKLINRTYPLTSGEILFNDQLIKQGAQKPSYTTALTDSLNMKMAPTEPRATASGSHERKIHFQE